MKAIAAWCFRHRRLVLLGWLIAVGAIFGLSQVTGSAFSNSFSLPGTESVEGFVPKCIAEEDYENSG